jgi:hypothetical protein
MDQSEFFLSVRAIPIVSVHISLPRSSSALLHLSSISHSVHDDDQITFFSIRAWSRPTRVLRFFLFFLFVRSLACVNGGAKKKEKIFIQHCALHTSTHSVAKYKEKAVFFFSFSVCCVGGCDVVSLQK